MLCPDSAQLSVPQTRSEHSTFASEDLGIISLHSVFEHRRVMTPDALRVFANESGVQFPIAIGSAQEGSSVPMTIAAWALDGTPTLMVFASDDTAGLPIMFVGGSLLIVAADGSSWTLLGTIREDCIFWVN